jgi:N-acetylglutamate synthase-like GNAT family acetyltransferase
MRSESALIREATPSDLPRLLILMQQLSAGGAHPETEVALLTPRHELVLAELMASQFSHLLVLEEDGQVLATCAVYIVPNLSHRGASWAIVENVVVDEACRGKGYGERLMAEAEQIARQGGAYRLSLMSNMLRADAHRFYARIGYEPSHQGFTKYFA